MRSVRKIRGYSQVDDPAGAEVLEQVLAQRRRLTDRLAPVAHTLAVASGKGGVGKSAVTANLAAALAARGHRVGAADGDLNGPSLARMLGATRQALRELGGGAVQPAAGAAGVSVMSMDLLLAADDTAVRWREPAEGAFLWQSSLETGTLREFLADVAWGPLDYLLIDLPPGTDKLARIFQLLPRLDGVLLVTTPSEVARFVVSKSVSLTRAANVPLVGLAANMTAHVCDACGHAAPLYDADGARHLAEQAGIPLWTEIPFDPRLASSTDAGRPFVLEAPAAPAARALATLAERVEQAFAGRAEDTFDGADGQGFERRTADLATASPDATCAEGAASFAGEAVARRSEEVPVGRAPVGGRVDASPPAGSGSSQRDEAASVTTTGEERP